MQPIFANVSTDAFGNQDSFLNDYVVMLHHIIDADKLKA